MLSSDQHEPGGGIGRVVRGGSGHGPGARTPAWAWIWRFRAGRIGLGTDRAGADRRPSGTYRRAVPAQRPFAQFCPTADVRSCCTAVSGVLANRRFSRGSEGAPVPLPENPKSHLHFKGLAPPVRSGAEPAELPKREFDVAGAQGIVSGMAGRYATALFELALEANADRRGSRRSRRVSTPCSPKVPISRAWCAARSFPPTSRRARSPPCSPRPKSAGSPRNSSRWWPRTAGCSRCATWSRPSASWSPSTRAR